MNQVSCRQSISTLFRSWLVAGALAAGFARTCAADVTCLGYDGRVSAGGSVFVYEVTCEDSVCVLATGSGPPNTATGCVGSTLRTDGGVSHEFGHADGDVSLTFSPSANGATLSGTSSAHATQTLGLPGLCTSGGASARSEVRFLITAPTVAHVQISSTEGMFHASDYGFNVTGATENHGATGRGTWDVLICPAAGGGGAVFTLRANPGTYAEFCYFILPGQPSPPTGSSSQANSFQASVQFRPVNGCLTVGLRGLEVVQSIQNWNNTLPLIEGKQTFVRAHLEATRTADIGKMVTGRLRGFRNNGELPGSPLAVEAAFPMNAQAELPADAAVNRGVESFTAATTHTLNFTLPPSWRSGEVTLRFETEDALLEPREPAEPGGMSRDGTVIAKFRPISKPRLILVPVRLAAPNGPPEPGPPADEIIGVLEKARKMFPIAEFAWNSRSPLVIRTNAGRDYSEEIMAAVSNRRSRMPGLGNAILMGVVADTALPLLRTAGQADDFGSGWAATNPRETFGHELGHILGREHAVSGTFPRVTIGGDEALQGACCEFAAVGSESFPHFFPVANAASISCSTPLPTTHRPTLGPMNLGVNAIVYGLEKGQNTLFPVRPNDTFELMSYCGARWVSDVTYLALQTAIETRFGAGPAPSPFQDGMAAPQLAALGDYLIVRGSVTAGAVSWLPFQRLNTSAPVPHPTGDYRLRLLDASGAVLEEASFAAELPAEIDPGNPSLAAPFIVTVPFAAAAQRVEISRNEIVIGSRVASASSPVVNLVSPNGGDVTRPEVEIRWTGSDPDGDELAYTIEYSADNGVNWETVAVDLARTNLVLNCAELPSGQQARFRVLASDGFHCAQDESAGSFSVPDKGPVLFVREPADNARFYANQLVAFSAVALDKEEGLLTGPQLEWRSDRDGLLGSGEELFLSAEVLTAGEHRITLTGRDAAGHATHATNSIFVFRTRPARLKILSATRDTGVSLEITGQVGTRSVIEISSNLATWTPWLTVTQFNLSERVAGPFTIGEVGRFHRVRSEPLPPAPLPPPSIVLQPGNQTVVAGRPLFLSVGAIGGEPLIYQWHADGTAIPGAVNAFLMLTNVQSADAGIYHVTIRNAAGAIQSSNATVAVIASDYAVLHSFTAAQSGLNPWGKLTVGSDGALYGCARNGGVSNVGCVFRLSTAGTGYTVLHQFRTTNGAIPLGGIIEGSDGGLYGTTSIGGTNNSGTVFRLNKDGSGFTVLRHFLAANDCRNPQAELLQASDGFLYGTTATGGGFVRGGVFRLSTAGDNYAIVSGFNFGGTEAPRQAIGGLIEGTDGLLYGTTEFGGSSNRGTIFRLNKAGTSATVLKSLGLVNGGAEQPNCTLVQTPDGLLYGTAAFGGSGGFGAVFRISTNGADFAIVHSFVAGGGREPRTGLIAAGDGSLLGTTRIGGGPDKGTLFRVERDNHRVSVLRTLNDFFGDGIRPRGPLARGSGGFYYGTTFGGGSADQGTVFRIWLRH